MDQRAHADGANHGADSVRLHDVARFVGAQPVHHLQERAEVAVPAPVADEEHGRKHASAEDGPVQQEGIWHEGDGGEEFLPQRRR